MTPAKKQDHSNHAFRPVLSVVAGVSCMTAFVLLGVAAFRSPSLQTLAPVFLAFSVLLLVAISRVYITKLQDRIIRLEMQVRLERLGRGPDFLRLSTPQLVALRFGSDAELPGLVDNALTGSLNPGQIKAAIGVWQADLHRT